MSWTSLPSGQAIPLVAGYFYALTAEVSNAHAAADIKSLAASKGFTLIDYQDPTTVPGQTPKSGYRFLATQFQATQAGTLPWGVPWYVPGDSSTLLQAWVAPPNPSSPAVPASVSSPSTWPWILGSVGALGLGWWLWKKHRRR
jgi:hypothetical protein